MKLASLVLGLLCVTSDAAFAADKSPLASPRILSQTTVFSDPHRDPYDLTNLRGFNHAPSIVRLPDGRLLAAWFSGPHEASVHQVILAAESNDDGKTWGAARVMQDFPRVSDFDPAFIVDGGRTWMFFSTGRWNRYPWLREEKLRVGIASFKTWQRFSDDSGKTWSEPVAIAEQGGPRNNGLLLATGELVVPFHEFTGKIAGVLFSKDHGKTWTRGANITGSAGAAEPSVAQLSSGRLLMVLRTRDGFLWRAFSDDRGQTWTAPEKTTLPASASPPNLFRLRDGRLLLTHHDSPTPLRTHLTMRISADDSATWGKPLALAEIAAPTPDERDYSRQVTHASVAQMADGVVVVVWVKIILSDEEQYGSVESARVQVE